MCQYSILWDYTNIFYCSDFSRFRLTFGPCYHSPNERTTQSSVDRIHLFSKTMDFSIVKVLILCNFHVVIFSSLYSKSRYVHENITWYQSQLLDYPALRVEINFHTRFPKSKCCPILCFFSNLPQDYKFVKQNCLSKLIADGMIYWYKGSSFTLPNNTQKYGKCTLKDDNYFCEISTAILNYEPKVRWLTFGYMCNEQKYLHGFYFKYIAKAQNTTQCELMKIPPSNSGFQCERFYQFVSFPNQFGHRSQSETFAYIHILQTLLANLDQTCYKHLDYLICQALLPRCPDVTLKEDGSGDSNGTNFTVSYLDVICEET